MTDPTARDLIQRLADALDEWQLGGAPPEDAADADLIIEARAYLNQLDLALEFHSKVSDLSDAVATLAQSEPEGPTPVHLSERQPTEADCDAHGWCWMFSPADLNVGLFGVAAHWCLRKPDPEIDEDLRTHWLPHWALPVPQQEASQ